MKTTPLSAHPDWVYLLRDIYNMYRYRSAGGSAVIRSHQKNVRQALARCVNADPEVILPTPREKPVCAHLGRALDQGRRENTASLIHAIEAVRPQLAWRYGYAKLPSRLARKYAFAEFAGPRGPVVCAPVILGIVLFAPRCTYPAHSHGGITESYICLSGASSENDAGVYAPGSLIYNPPEQQHRITSGDLEPCLMLYAWLGPREQLAHPKMEFSRPRKQTASDTV